MPEKNLRFKTRLVVPSTEHIMLRSGSNLLILQIKWSIKISVILGEQKKRFKPKTDRTEQI